MKIHMNDLDIAIQCPVCIELSKDNPGIKYQSTDFVNRCHEILDSYYSRFMIGTNFFNSRMKTMFCELADEHYKKYGGDINKCSTEKLLFDEFINCCFDRVDKSAGLMANIPIEMAVDYNHIIYGDIDVLIENTRRPKQLQIVLYKNQPKYPLGSEAFSSMTLKFIKSYMNMEYSFDLLKNAIFIIYSFAPPSIRKIKFTSVDISNFRNISGRIGTTLELGLFFPHYGRHCFKCKMRNCCHHRPHNSSSSQESLTDKNEFLKNLSEL